MGFRVQVRSVGLGFTVEVWVRVRGLELFRIQCQDLGFRVQGGEVIGSGCRIRIRNKVSCQGFGAALQQTFSLHIGEPKILSRGASSCISTIDKYKYTMYR